MKVKNISSLLLLSIIAFSFVNVFGQSKYKTYSNARFGYSISYPSDLLVPQGEAQNGDGQKFLSKDGRTEMLVYGRYKLDDEDSLRKMYDEAVADLGNATYKVIKSDWFVVSGKREGKIYYRKTMLKNDIFMTFSIEYDESKRKTYDAVTTRISKSFWFMG